MPRHRGRKRGFQWESDFGFPIGFGYYNGYGPAYYPYGYNYYYGPRRVVYVAPRYYWHHNRRVYYRSRHWR